MDLVSDSEKLYRQDFAEHQTSEKKGGFVANKSFSISLKSSLNRSVVSPSSVRFREIFPTGGRLGFGRNRPWNPRLDRWLERFGP